MTDTRILSWRPLRRGALLGFAKVAFPSGVVLAEVAIMRGPTHAWCAPPTRPRLHRGELVRKTNGKIQQLDLIEFMSSDIKDRWSHSIIAALRAQYPDFDSDDGEGDNYSE
jgi:hypothetical protein